MASNICAFANAFVPLALFNLGVMRFPSRVEWGEVFEPVCDGVVKDCTIGGLVPELIEYAGGGVRGRAGGSDFGKIDFGLGNGTYSF